MKLRLTLALLSLSYIGYSQVGIGTTEPDPSSILDISSTNSGFLLPRINLQDTNDTSTISNPAEGLMIYNLSSNCNLAPGIYVFNGTKWRRINYTDSETYSRLVRDEIGVSNVTFTNINTTNSYGGFTSLFDNVDNTGGSSFHVNRTSLTQDWGFSITLPTPYFITEVILDGRNDCCTTRIVNVLIKLYRCGNLIHASSALTSASTGDNNITIPYIYADEIRVVIPNGGDTGGSGSSIINFSELDIIGRD